MDSIVVEASPMEIEESDKKAEKRRRKCHNRSQEDDSFISDKLYKKIILCLTKPSYLLGVAPGSKSFRWEHRQRLCKILSKLLRQHNWKEASGVLSVLLQGTTREKCPRLNRFKYTALLELLKHLNDDDVNPSRIKNIYDTWISRTGSTGGWPIEDRSLVYLEQIFLFLAQGDEEDAAQAASSLMQRGEFGSHPMSYMVVGLTFYQLWHSKFLKEMQWRESDQFDTPRQSETVGTRCSNQDGYLEGRNAIYSHETGTSLRYDSETSVMNDKRISLKANYKPDGTASMEVVDEKLERKNPPKLVQPVGFYMTSDENQASMHNDAAHIYDPSFFTALGCLESWLLPLQLPQNSEYYVQILSDSYYKDAVKYLRLALHSAPPVLAALHPLVQLLIIGGQVDDAMNEIEKFCNNSNAALPFRIRAGILESFDSNNSMLSKYYEDILKKDPTCCHSLARLINMHQNGDFAPESLLEMIALHLDATYAECKTWREFALCILKLSRYDEDRVSVCLNVNEGEQKQRYSVRYNRIPKVFSDGKSGKAWRLRCKWWLTRHFSNKMLASDIATGDLELLTHKAACASHMYGQEHNYVIEAYKILQNDENRDLFMFLRMHMQNSVRLQPNFQQRTNI